MLTLDDDGDDIDVDAIDVDDDENDDDADNAVENKVVAGIEHGVDLISTTNQAWTVGPVQAELALMVMARLIEDCNDVDFRSEVRLSHSTCA